MKLKFTPLVVASFASACVFLSSVCAQAQPTLQLRYTFEDGPGTTTTNTPGDAVYPVVLNMVAANGTTPTDLHGAANSGVQGQGHSMDLSANGLQGNVNGAFALTVSNATLANLGVVSDFTATIWFKMPNLFTNIANQGPRLWVLAQPGATDLNVANTIGLQFGSRSAASQAPTPLDDLNAFVGATRISPPVYYDFPTNVWIFCALVYDSVNGYGYVYYGTEASPAKLYAVKQVTPQGLGFDFSAGASLSIGNRISNARDFAGPIDEFRFYTGVGDANFVEGVRQASLPVTLTNLSPDGSVLLSGTNVLNFTATSANGIANNNIQVKVNGTDVSSSLAFGGTPNAVTVTYTNLPVNSTLLQQVSLNGVNVSIRVVDNNGIVATNSYIYDSFAPTNFSFECEDYDFGGGLFIPNPVVDFTGANTNSYYQNPTMYVDQVDANDNGNTAGPSRLYRDPTENVETEYSIGNGNNGGNSLGELWRQNVKDAFTNALITAEVNVGYFDGGTGAGLPNWMNYTRAFPAGNYNVYLRVADGGGNLTASLDILTNGWGTTTQTTTNLGTFSMANSGGWDSFAWVPLRDSGGNLAHVQLSGTNTLRLTAGNGGGGNVNFLLFTPANTNLPTINNVYPNGTNMFQPSPALSFKTGSPIGALISTNGVKVKLTYTNLLGQGFVTNLTATNGLTFSGTSPNFTVSAPLKTNAVYTAVISVADTNGTAVGSSVSFDTLSPVYTWEAPDYDYAGGQFIPDPIPVDGYLGLSGIQNIDDFYANIPPANTYRDSAVTGVEGNGDSPLRLQYLTNSPAPQAYDIGYFNGGNWLNYTRNFPAGEYNIYVRAADGSTSGALGNVGVSVITNEWGQADQSGTNLGTFNIPVTGGWQTYTWAPLRDATGNLVKFNGGTTNTLKMTSAGSQNVFFFALFQANTNLPVLANIYPLSGSAFTNAFSFNVTSPDGVASNKIVVTVNGTVVSNLVFSGSINNWLVKYPLAPNSAYSIQVSVTDVNGNTATTTTLFDTINPNNYTWEAEDWDYSLDSVNGGLFIDNPQTNAYAGLTSVPNVDTVQVNFAGTYTYRNPGMDTEVNGDILRPQYQDPNNPQSDYTMGYFSDGAWANYTRHYPAGNYNVYARVATSSATGSDAALYQVTGGWNTPNQTTNFLGTFTIPNTGAWETYAYVPLRDSSGNLVSVNFNGSTNTLRLVRPSDSPASADVNVNYLMLAPVFASTLSTSGTNVVLSFPTVTNFHYQLQYKTNLTDKNWISIGTAVGGNNSTQSLSSPIISVPSRFYRVLIQ